MERFGAHVRLDTAHLPHHTYPSHIRAWASVQSPTQWERSTHCVMRACLRLAYLNGVDSRPAVHILGSDMSEGASPDRVNMPQNRIQ